VQFLSLSSESDADEKECTSTSLFLRKGREGKRLELVKGGEHGKEEGKEKGAKGNGEVRGIRKERKEERKGKGG
jgi:hypothetical protein